MRTPEEILTQLGGLELTAAELEMMGQWVGQRAAPVALDAAIQAARLKFFPPPPRLRVTWRYVSGGRALHGFVQECGAPLCGVIPERSNGLTPNWISTFRDPHDFSRGVGAGRFKHSECLRQARLRGIPL